MSEQQARVIKELVAIAEEIGCTPAQVALNWLRSQPGVVIPVIGSRRRTQVQENLECLKSSLTPEQVQRLAAASQIELGFPHDFLASDEVRDLVYGGMFPLITPSPR
jgi:aryl-alcohol dehydrogenase-like predicted oxidoreductase